MFSKNPTWRSKVPVGKEAYLIYHLSGGSEGWDFPVITENQWSILFLTCHEENSALFCYSHIKIPEQNDKK